MFRWGIGASTLVLAAFILGLPWGIIGVAIAYAIASVLLFYPNFAIPFRLIDLPFLQLLKVLWLAVLTSSLMCIVLIGFQVDFSVISLQYFCVDVVCGFWYYCLCCHKLDDQSVELGENYGI